MMSQFLLLGALSCLPRAIAQVGTISPLVQPCNASLPKVLCINKYASVMPYHFYRQTDGPSSNSRPFGSTSVPSDTSFADISSADFLVFDQERGSELLGSSPSYEYIFPVSDAVHEAPVYVPSQNKLYFTQLAPPPGYLPQLVIDLNQDPPTLSEYLPDPPVYAVNGGTFSNGLIYWGASGGNNSIGGEETRVGLVTVDPSTNKSTYLLNNYYGFYFNTVDDLFVHPNGDIWFTDPREYTVIYYLGHTNPANRVHLEYSWFNHLTDTAPQLPSLSYRFRPSTGAVSIVDDYAIQPNGIALSPDATTVYISDTGAESAPITQSAASQVGATFSPLGRRTIYAFNISCDGTYLFNRRPIWYAQDWVPDGRS